MYFLFLLINRVYGFVKKCANYFSASLLDWSSWVELMKGCSHSAFDAQEARLDDIMTPVGLAS